MSEYRLPQHDDSPERAETIKSARSVYKYRMDYGVPVADGFRMEDGPGREWQTKVLFHQEMLHLNMRSLVRSGRWTFTGDTPQLKPLTLVKLLQERDAGGIFRYFVPKLGVATENARATSLEDFRAVFAKAPLPAVADTFQSDETFAENFVAGPDPTRLKRLDAVPAKFPIKTEHLRSVPGLPPSIDLPTEIKAGHVFWVDHVAMNGMSNGSHPLGSKYMYSALVSEDRGGLGLGVFDLALALEETGKQVVMAPLIEAAATAWALAKAGAE